MSACGYLGVEFGADGVALGGAPGGARPEEVDEDDGAAPSGSGGKGESGGTSSGSTGAASGGDGDLGMGGELSSDGGATASGGRSNSSGGTNSGGSSAGGSDPGTGGVGSGGAAAGGSGGGGGTGGQAATGGQPGTGGATSEDCGVSDSICSRLVSSLVHRYSFDGGGTTIFDSVGAEHGTARGTVLAGNGQLNLNGVGAYVDLPAGLISSLPNVTLEIWFLWRGGPPWQKPFEFGDTDFFNDPVNYLYITPEGGGSVPAENGLAAGLRHLGGGDRQLRTTEFTETGQWVHVVLVVDDEANRLSFFKNATWLAERFTEVRLVDIRDDTNRLGRSLFPDDPYFDGVITEFRIYDEVLTEDLIEKSFEWGPDAVFSSPD